MFLQLLSVTMGGTKAATAEALKAVVAAIDANPGLMTRKVRAACPPLPLRFPVLSVGCL